MSIFMGKSLARLARLSLAFQLAHAKLGFHDVVAPHAPLPPGAITVEICPAD